MISAQDKKVHISAGEQREREKQEGVNQRHLVLDNWSTQKKDKESDVDY